MSETPEKSIEGEIRAWAAERRLDQPSLDSWLALDGKSAAVMLDLAKRLRMRTGQFRTAFEMLAELAAVDRGTIARVLARPALQRILEGPGSGPARAQAFLDEVRTVRFPRLARLRERLTEEIARLGLPAQIAVSAPSSLESDELRIEMRVRSASELDDSIDALVKNMTGLKRIVGILGGDEF